MEPCHLTLATGSTSSLHCSEGVGSDKDKYSCRNIRSSNTAHLIPSLQGITSSKLHHNFNTSQFFFFTFRNFAHIFSLLFLFFFSADRALFDLIFSNHYSKKYFTISGSRLTCVHVELYPSVMNPTSKFHGFVLSESYHLAFWDIVTKNVFKIYILFRNSPVHIAVP